MATSCSCNLPGEKRSGRGDRPCILCIDDDPRFLSILVGILKNEGFRVSSASSGQEGLAVFRAALAGNCRYEAVVTDLVMPDMRGDQVAQDIKSQSPDTWILMLTGSSHAMASDGKLPEGIDRLMIKPVSIEEIRRALKELIGQSKKEPSPYRA